MANGNNKARKSTDGRAPKGQLSGAPRRPTRPSRAQQSGGDLITEALAGTVISTKLSPAVHGKRKAVTEPGSKQPKKAKSTTPTETEEVLLPSTAIKDGLWEKKQANSNLPACSYCMHGGTLYQCDRLGCAEQVCLACVPGITDGIAHGISLGFKEKDLWLICQWCGKTEMGLYLPTGERCGEPLTVVAPIMGNTARHHPRRALCVVHLRLDQEELNDAGHPFELFRRVLAAQRSLHDFYSSTVKFNCDVKRNKVVADKQDQTMQALAERINDHFKGADFELIVFITTHITTEGSADEVGNLQVVAKSAKHPDGVGVDPWEFFHAVFSEEWKEMMRNHETTVFMMTCGALVNEPAPRSALLDVAVDYQINTLLAPTTPVSEPASFGGFCVTWATEITAARLEPATLMHQLVAGAMFHLHNVGVAVYYGPGSIAVIRDPRLQNSSPAFIQYVWHKLPTSPYGQPQPRMCSKCRAVYSWGVVDQPDERKVRVVCTTPGCDVYKDISVPSKPRETGYVMGGGHWMTVIMS